MCVVRLLHGVHSIKPEICKSKPVRTSSTASNCQFWWMCCVQTALKLLGLDVCADTIVGHELMRGISGGQRKRVTSGTHLQICCHALASYAWVQSV